MITEFSKYKTGIIVIRVDSFEESMKIQKLAFKYDYLWVNDGTKKLFTMDISYIFIDISEKSLYAGYDAELCDIKPWLNERNWNRITYTLDDYDTIETLLKYGRKKPIYKPKGEIKRIDEDKKTGFIRRNMIIIKVNSVEEVEKIEKLCIKNGYSWLNETYLDYIKPDITYITILFDYKKMSFTSVSYDMYPEYNKYTVNDINLIDHMLKRGYEDIKPSYKPKGKIKRIDEDRNSMHDASEIAILIESIIELHIIYNIIKKYGYEENDDYIEMLRCSLQTGHKVVIFINIIDKNFTVNSRYDVYMSHHVWTKESDFNGVWKRLLTFKDIKLIDQILRLQKITIKPSYKPKGKIKRIDESTTSDKAQEIGVIVKNIDELHIFRDIADKYNYDFKELNYLSERLIDNQEMVIFFHLKHKNIDGSVYYNDKFLEYFIVHDDIFGYKTVWENLLTIDDLFEIENILRFGKIIFKPIYKPKGKSLR